jgi:hypothetical protein
LFTDLKCEESCVNDAFEQAYNPEHAMYLIIQEEQCCLDSSNLVNITVSNTPQYGYGVSVDPLSEQSLVSCFVNSEKQV